MGRSSVGQSKTQLLNKIKNEGKKTKKELSQQMKSSNFWAETFRTLALIGFYYVASIGLTFYQNWLLKVTLAFHMKAQFSVVNPPETQVELQKRRANFGQMKYNSMSRRRIELYFMRTKLSFLLCNSTSVSGRFFNNTESNIYFWSKYFLI